MAFIEVPQTYSYEFGLRLYPAGNSLITTAIVTVNDKKVVKAEIIPEGQFLLEMSGAVHSKANPAPDDLFYKNGIFSCSRTKDTVSIKFKKHTDFVVQDLKVECPILGELWKVRYRRDIRIKNYNYGSNIKPTGWAGDSYFPSLRQIEYLKANYGSDGINEFIYGEKLYKFLKDVQDTAWISNYKSLR